MRCSPSVAALALTKRHELTRFFQFVASFMKLNLPLHLLFCNAGQMLSPFRYHALSGSGFEKQFAANHLGHFHLVNRLLGVMEGSSSGNRAFDLHALRAAVGCSTSPDEQLSVFAASAPCRIICTASLAHWGALQYPRAFVQEASSSSRWFAYSESKLMNVRETFHPRPRSRHVHIISAGLVRQSTCQALAQPRPASHVLRFVPPWNRELRPLAPPSAAPRSHDDLFTGS